MGRRVILLVVLQLFDFIYCTQIVYQPMVGELPYWAARYAAEGCAIFPLTPDAKKPLPGTRGFKDATHMSAKQAEILWESKYEGHNIGVTCGRASGNLIIIDVEADQECRHPLPKTRLVMTTKGGRHYYYRTPPRRGVPKRRTGIESVGGDILGEGGYAVGAGSIVNGGVYDCLYDYDISECPEWVYLVCTKENIKFRNKSARYASALKRKEFDINSVPEIGHGERNTMLTSIAGLLKRRDVPLEEARQIILEIGATKCPQSTDWTEMEQLRIVEGIYSRYPN